jgi:hypothetical protein
MRLRVAALSGARVELLGVLVALAAGALFAPAFFDPLVPAVLAVAAATLAFAVGAALLAGLIPSSRRRERRAPRWAASVRWRSRPSSTTGPRSSCWGR